MTLKEDVFVYFKVEGEPDLAKINKGMVRLGYNLRLAGRDLMRMGSSLQRFGGQLTSIAFSVFQSSDIVQDAFGDIAYALEDIFEAAGILEPVVELLEKIAEIIEANPMLAWVFAFLALGGVLAMLLGKGMMLLGWIKLVIGSVLSAQGSTLSWGEKIKWVIYSLMGLGEELKKTYAEEVRQAWAMRVLAGQTKDLGISLTNTATQLKAAGPQYKASAAWANRLDQHTTNLSEDLLRQSTQAGMVTSEFKDVKGNLVKTGKAAKKTGFSFKGLASFGLSLGAFFILIGPAMEMLGPMFESLASVGEQMIEPFMGWIDTMADLIEENPMLAASILGVLAAILGFSKIKAGFENLKDFASWLKKTPEHLSQLKTILIGAKNSIVAFGGKFKEVLKTGWDFVKGLGPKLTSTLASAGLGFKSLAAGIGGVIAGFMIGYLVSTMLVRAFGPLGKVISALVGVLAIGAAAWIAYHAAQSGPLAPGTVALIMGAVGFGIAAILGAFAALPSFEGLKSPITFGEQTVAVLHPGETLLPAGRGYLAPEPPMEVSVNVTGASSIEEIVKRSVRASVDQLSSSMERKYRAKEY